MVKPHDFGVQARGGDLAAPPQNRAAATAASDFARAPSSAPISPQIAAVIAQLPAEPGVYIYYEGEKPLYVGKAKSLKNRVRSYFAFTPQLRASPRVNARIALMLSRASKLLYHTTPSELDALVLENSLIKQLHPKFNILLRDDKTYPYICVDFSQPFARFELTRKIKSGAKMRYFGPYASGAKALLEAIYESFLLRQKKSCKKACLFAQINRCCAPCEHGELVAPLYQSELKAAIKALKNPQKLIKSLEEKMYKAASCERFEEAARLRDICAALNKSKAEHSMLDLARNASFDAIAIAQNQANLQAIRLVVSGGKVISIIKEKASGFDADEFLRAFILAQYRELAPRKIYLANELADAALIESWLKEQTGTIIKILSAKAADVRALINSASKIALSELEKAAPDVQICEQLAATLGLSCVPSRIEVFDNSMLFGTARVGAMVVYENGWCKSFYRSYLLEGLNDYEQMRQMLTRRIARFSEQAPPSLWVIDGGKALLDLAISLLKSANASVEVIAISKQKRDHLAYRAKGAAADIIYTKDEIFRLLPTHAVLQFVQKLRDEAHRFAISTHRARKRKEDMQLSQLAQAGISAASSAKLVKFFGTFGAIMKASSEEIRALTNASVAAKIAAIKKQSK